MLPRLVCQTTSQLCMPTGCVEYPTFCQTSQASEGGEENAENMQIVNML